MANNRDYSLKTPPCTDVRASREGEREKQGEGEEERG